MSDLFHLAMPWWEFVLRALVVYAVLLTLIRVSGKRTIGQYTPFDLVLIALLGNAVQNSLLGDDHSLLGGLLLAATLIGMNWLVAAVTSRNKPLDRVIEGEPVVLAQNGRVHRDRLKRENISQADFEEAMREADCADDADIRVALLETDGRITVIRQGEKGRTPHAGKE